MLTLAFACAAPLLSVAHVLLSASQDNCYHLAHDHAISQVAHLRGSGGLELDHELLDVIGGEVLKVDAMFKHRYDTSTYALYIGCGGCSPFDPLLVSPVARSAANSYGDALIEPFTQTPMRSGLPEKHLRNFDSRKLASCTSKHVTIRVVDYHNRTDADHCDLIWAAVIASPKESFTMVEFVSFPIFILQNHALWNEAGWTVYVLMLLSLLAVSRAFGAKVRSYHKADDPGGNLQDTAKQPLLHNDGRCDGGNDEDPIGSWPYVRILAVLLFPPAVLVLVRSSAHRALCAKSGCAGLASSNRFHEPPWIARVQLLMLALVFFLGAWAELILHSWIAHAATGEHSARLFVDLLTVWAFAAIANGIPSFLTWAIFEYSVVCQGSGQWYNNYYFGVLELFFGYLWLFNIGAGFFFGPIFIVLDATVRLYENAPSSFLNSTVTVAVATPRLAPVVRLTYRHMFTNYRRGSVRPFVRSTSVAPDPRFLY